MPSLPPLATTDDITGRLGRELSDAETQRLPYLLKDVSSKIRRYCNGKDFLYHAGDEVEVPSFGGKLKLPYRPIDAVNSVIAISGHPSVPDIPVSWYVFDGIDEVTIGDASMSGVINLSEDFYDGDLSYPGTYRVNYDHGYQEVPDDVVMVAANAVVAVLTAPTQAGGIIGETIGAYSYRLARAGGGLAVALSEADLEDLNDFRDSEDTMGLKP